MQSGQAACSAASAADAISEQPEPLKLVKIYLEHWNMCKSN